jgi:hypothetical protein
MGIPMTPCVTFGSESRTFQDLLDGFLEGVEKFPDLLQERLLDGEDLVFREAHQAVKGLRSHPSISKAFQSKGLREGQGDVACPFHLKGIPGALRGLKARALQFPEDFREAKTKQEGPRLGLALRKGRHRRLLWKIGFLEPPVGADEFVPRKPSVSQEKYTHALKMRWKKG